MESRARSPASSSTGVTSPTARAELGQPASYSVVRAAWAAGILVVSVPLAVMWYRRG